ncbi:Rhomboid protease GlpG [Thalassoglobus neptunius]|uniref:Rhomboid protease GlpG n=1 Tax=Thalassoglobus neptunius TaxID=1938619 RepID=A0A5C5WZ54_9PLAN|nr:rhomboid family intramembrane serine protease [Thalassoglobus neptunius]TWT55569.1 Rhomboid protease GlpG [Thalassoglobus neptunius]
MRKIGTFDSQSLAERFHWFLISKEIENQLDEVPPHWEIWVLDDDLLPKAQEELTAFLESPDDPRFKVSPPKIVKKPKPTPRRTTTDYSSIRVTRFLIVACVVLTIYTGMGTRHPEVVNWLLYSKFQKTGPNWPLSPEIMRGEIWRLVTPIFIHLSVLHLLMNMYWMWILGGIIERRQGPTRLIILTILTAAGSSMTQYFLFGPAFSGISGVVYGLLGYLWMKSMVSPEEQLGVPQSLVLFMLVWLFLGMSGSLEALGMRIANGAHFGGLMAGMLVGSIRSWK